MGNRLLPVRGPGRKLAIISVVNMLGSGCWVTSNALYLTKFVGLSATEVGTGVSVAALVCLCASTPMGYLADIRGPRSVQVTFYVVLAVLYGAMLLVNSFWSFLVVASLTALADAGQRGARGALIAGTIPEEDRVQARALNRTMANVGYTVGGVLGGAAIAIGSVTAYRLLIGGNAVSYLAVAVMACGLPYLPPIRREAAQPRLKSLKDRAYLTFVALDGIMSMHNDLLSLVLPLWIDRHTGAPTWIAAACVVLNTAMVILFQIRAARGTRTISGSVRATRSAGLLIAAACLVFAASTGQSAVPATILLLSAELLHVIGKLRHAASGWGLSFGLAPPTMQGQYQATYAMGEQLGHLIAGVALTFLILRLEVVGWMILAVLVTAPALTMKSVAFWKLKQIRLARLRRPRRFRRTRTRTGARSPR